MSLVKWEPFQSIDRFFEDFSPLTGSEKSGWDLAADIYEENGNVVAEMNLPGLDPEDIDITIEGNHLRISGSREEEIEDTSKNYYAKEIRRGRFERAIRLPSRVSEDDATANYDNGVLIITMPKLQDRKKLSINVGSSQKEG